MSSGVFALSPAVGSIPAVRGWPAERWKFLRYYRPSLWKQTAEASEGKSQPPPPAGCIVPEEVRVVNLPCYAGFFFFGRPGPPLRFGKTVPDGKTSNTTRLAAERTNRSGTSAIAEADISRFLIA